jgi:hypothetical protein
MKAKLQEKEAEKSQISKRSSEYDRSSRSNTDAKGNRRADDLSESGDDFSDISCNSDSDYNRSFFAYFLKLRKRFGDGVPFTEASRMYEKKLRRERRKRTLFQEPNDNRRRAKCGKLLDLCKEANREKSRSRSNPRKKKNKHGKKTKEYLSATSDPFQTGEVLSPNNSHESSLTDMYNRTEMPIPDPSEKVARKKGQIPQVQQNPDKKVHFGEPIATVLEFTRPDFEKVIEQPGSSSNEGMAVTDEDTKCIRLTHPYMVQQQQEVQHCNGSCCQQQQAARTCWSSCADSEHRDQHLRKCVPLGHLVGSNMQNGCSYTLQSCGRCYNRCSSCVAQHCSGPCN